MRCLERHREIARGADPPDVRRDSRRARRRLVTSNEPLRGRASAGDGERLVLHSRCWSRAELVLDCHRRPYVVGLIRATIPSSPSAAPSVRLSACAHDRRARRGLHPMRPLVFRFFARQPVERLPVSAGVAFWSRRSPGVPAGAGVRDPRRPAVTAREYPVAAQSPASRLEALSPVGLGSVEQRSSPRPVYRNVPRLGAVQLNSVSDLRQLLARGLDPDECRADRRLLPSAGALRSRPCFRSTIPGAAPPIEPSRRQEDERATVAGPSADRGEVDVMRARARRRRRSIHRSRSLSTSRRPPRTGAARSGRVLLAVL